MRVAHISDLHLFDPSPLPLRSFLNKRITGLVNYRLARSHVHTLERASAIVAELARHKVDHLVVTGDLTNLALPGELQMALELLRDRTGIDSRNISVIPGNHDIYTGEAARSGQFTAVFQSFMGDDLPDLRAKVPAGCFPRVKVRGNLAFVSLSSAVPRLPLVASGHVGREQLEALRRILRDASVAGRGCVVAIHHPPVNPRSRLRRYLRGLDDAAEVLEVLGEHPRVTVLHGHLHHRVARRVGGITILGVPSASCTRGGDLSASAFHLLEFGTEGALQSAEAHWTKDGRTFERRPIEPI